MEPFWKNLTNPKLSRRRGNPPDGLFQTASVERSARKMAAKGAEFSGRIGANPGDTTS
jgi:hypothetical protein